MSQIPVAVTAVGYIIGLSGLAGFMFAFFRLDNYKGTIKLQNDNIKALKDQSQIHEDRLVENLALISKLRSEIDIIKELPLQMILDQLKQITSTQNKILIHLAGGNGKAPAAKS